MLRADVSHAIKLHRDALRAELGRRQTTGARLGLDDEVTVSRLLDEACAEVGLPRAAYEQALRDDPSLRELSRHALEEALTEPSDPGPNDEISRESPAGNPENWHVHDWNGIDPPGGVGGSCPPSWAPGLSDPCRRRAR